MSVEFVDDDDDSKWDFKIIDVLSDAIKQEQLGEALGLADVAKPKDFEEVFEMAKTLGLAATEVSQLWTQMQIVGFKQDRHSIFTLRVLVENRALQRCLASMNSLTNCTIVKLKRAHK